MSPLGAAGTIWRRCLERRIPAVALVALTSAAHCGSGPDNGCPLQIRRVYLSGRAPQVIVRNKAHYPVGQVVVHAAYEDLFHKYHEPTQAFDTIVQPNQRVTLSLDPIKGTSVEWETLNVFATCQPADSSSRSGSDSAR